MAKRLKEEGFNWEPKYGDMYYFKDAGPATINNYETLEHINGVIEFGNHTFAPNIDQLKEEVTRNNCDHFEIEYWGEKYGDIWVFYLHRGTWYEFRAETLEDAVAKGILCMYKEDN